MGDLYALIFSKYVSTHLSRSLTNIDSFQSFIARKAVQTLFPNPGIPTVSRHIFTLALRPRKLTVRCSDALTGCNSRQASSLPDFLRQPPALVLPLYHSAILPPFSWYQNNFSHVDTYPYYDRPCVRLPLSRWCLWKIKCDVYETSRNHVWNPCG